MKCRPRFALAVLLFALAGLPGCVPEARLRSAAEIAPGAGPAGRHIPRDVVVVAPDLDPRMRPLVLSAMEEALLAVRTESGPYFRLRDRRHKPLRYRELVAVLEGEKEMPEDFHPESEVGASLMIVVQDVRLASETAPGLLAGCFVRSMRARLDVRALRVDNGEVYEAGLVPGTAGRTVCPGTSDPDVRIEDLATTAIRKAALEFVRRLAPGDTRIVSTIGSDSASPDPMAMQLFGAFLGTMLRAMEMEKR